LFVSGHPAALETNIDGKADNVRHRKNPRLALAATLALVGGSLALVAGTAAPAQAAPNVTINLVGINDFHGRIDANTVKWAGTVKKLEVDTPGVPAANSLIVGAGDLIGASVFASAVANDQPTIDVMNEVGMDASAVGNHEFDKGWPDLRDRVIGPTATPNAHWAYLGANVYKKGTQTPALPEYATYTIDGVRVGVIGAVTQETPTLVSPGGITDLDFGDPVAAVNRVAGQLSDGNAANGEADVLVATFHAGSGVATSYPDALANGGAEFASMANLDPHIDAIFNGHTHQKYVFNQPVTGGDRPTRPMVQTGQYGENVGQILLTYDTATGKVIDSSASNTARVTTDDATLIAQYPVLQQVKNTVDAALANAKVVGDQPVGKISADITTAFSGGGYVSGRYAGGTRDQRGSESTLGDLVANALRDGLPAAQGNPDIGIVNPGGLRDELLYAGSPASNPANTDGVVTYAEANSVLPFVNNIWTIQLTGKQLKSVLEQQWQPTGADRPYLALGLSDNVRVTQNADNPVGSRITSVLIDGVPLDNTKTYTVSTFSFLGTGGDNFTAFKDGKAKDTGLVDRDVWVGWLKKASTRSPNFARQQVQMRNMPRSVEPNKKVTFRVFGLDLTSLGSPQNTEVGVYATTVVKNKPVQVKLGEFPVAAGLAKMNFRTPDIRYSQLSVVAEPSRTKVGIFHGSFSEKIKAKPRLATSKSPTPAIVGKTREQVSIEVKVPGMSPTGWAAVKIGKQQYQGKLVDGKVTIKLPKFNKTGKQKLKVKYLGNDNFKRAFKFINLWVVKG
jgi:5'-nucleotidase